MTSDQSRHQRLKQRAVTQEWKKFAKVKMDGPLFHTDVRFGNEFITSLIDQGCSSYATVNPATVRRHKLQTLPISPRSIIGFLKEKQTITRVAYGPMDISGHQQDQVFAYVVPGQSENLILSKKWMEDQDVVLSARKGYLMIKSTGIRIQDNNLIKKNDVNAQSNQVSSSIFISLVRRAWKQPDSGTEIFTASLRDIKKTLAVKK